MNHLALFNGIGGFQLAAKWVGWNNVAHVEIDEFCNKVVAFHFPQSKCYLDVKKFKGEEYNGAIDIISGGFPCQPFSQAGKRKGTEDDRNLWPEMFRIIQQVRPKYVVAENVYGIINWSGGLVFNQVQADLEDEGYTVQSVILPAAGKNAPHKRDRVWFIAYSGQAKPQRRKKSKKGQQFKGRREAWSKSSSSISIQPSSDSPDNGCRGREGKQCIPEQSRGVQQDKQETGSLRSEAEGRNRERTSSDSNLPGTDKRLRINRQGEEKDYRREEFTQPESGENSAVSSDTEQEGLQGSQLNESLRKKTEEGRKQSSGPTPKFYKIPNWKQFPTQPPICDGDDGLSSRLDAITFPKWRNESIKALGNAIVPQVAYEIFKTIQFLENEN